MTDTTTERITECPPEGPPPIYDTDHLKARIAALPQDRMDELAVNWVANNIPEFNGLVDADTYRRAEHLVNAAEPTAPADAFEHVDLCQRLAELPEHIANNAWEAIGVYAGTRMVSTHDLISTGRLNEVRRIVTEAVAYAKSLGEAPHSVVTQLPPADDTRELTDSDHYPGAKADSKTVLAWVGANRNRAARAYAHEKDRNSPRKGVTSKLEAVLGDDGLLAVQTRLAAAVPPLDLSAGGQTSPAAPAVGEVPAETGAAGPGVATTPDASTDGSPPVAVEAEPAAPTPTADDTPPHPRVTVVPPLETHLIVANALDLIAEGITALAYAVREGA